MQAMESSIKHIKAPFVYAFSSILSSQGTALGRILAYTFVLSITIFLYSHVENKQATF